MSRGVEDGSALLHVVQGTVEIDPSVKHCFTRPSCDTRAPAAYTTALLYSVTPAYCAVVRLTAVYAVRPGSMYSVVTSAPTELTTLTDGTKPTRRDVGALGALPMLPESRNEPAVKVMGYRPGATIPVAVGEPAGLIVYVTTFELKEPLLYAPRVPPVACAGRAGCPTKRLA